MWSSRNLGVRRESFRGICGKLHNGGRSRKKAGSLNYRRDLDLDSYWFWGNRKVEVKVDIYGHTIPGFKSSKADR